MLWFLSIFAKKIGEKIGVFYSKQSWIIQQYDHNIGFWDKRHFFSPKIVENRRK
jgi:hypothetical protein